MWFVYILLCGDGSFYTGISNNLKKRLLEHQSGQGSRYTRSHQPVKLIYQEKLSSYSAALRREMEIKKWSRERKMKTLT